MKKNLKNLLPVAVVFMITLGCALSVPAEEGNPARVVALKGPTAMGMVKMMDEADQAGDEAGYSFQIVSAVDEVPPMLVKGEADIAAIPANLASVLYNNTEGKIEVLAVNTLGVLYLVDTSDTIHSVTDLRGRTLYASGKGATPEYALNYILSANGLDPENDLTIEWKSEHAECLASLLADENGIAMLPQPFVTTAQMKDDRITVALDLTEEWDRLQEDEEDPSSMITGVVVARKDYIDASPESVESFLADYEASVTFVQENPEEAAALIGGYEIVPEQVAIKALPACNITYIEGTQMKKALSGYLQVLFDQNPQSVGGKLPDDDFYFGG